MLFPIAYTNSSSLYNEMSSSKCTLEIASLPYGDKVAVQKSRYGADLEDQKSVSREDPEQKRMSALLTQLEGTGDKERWQILSKELAQKQEIINRMMKEIDEKKQSLKLTGAEIVDLRRSIKLLQNENAILRRRLGEEEQIQLSQMVTKEIAKMSSEELRVKIVKLAQAYRAERLRNDEFDKALKGAHSEISAAKKMETELEGLQNAHQEKARRLLEMQREVQKINLYKDTIKKQEKVIAKLEALLNKTVKDTKQSRQDVLELEKLKTENLQLQKELKASAIQKGDSSPDIERYRREIARLEDQIAQLQKELRERREAGGNRKEEDWEMDKIELEVKLQKAEARNKAIEDEMSANAQAYAKQIADLKAELQQKESIIQAVALNSADTSL
jgi:chromosome segregation ATPase